MIPQSMKKSLLQGELADLALYRALRKRAKGEFAKTLDEFIETEIRHAAFWRGRFGLKEESPGLAGKTRNAMIRAVVAVFGEPAGYLFLEAVETHGIKQYLHLLDRVQDDEMRKDLRTILTEEVLHEDEAATGGARTVDPGVIRNAFLGFNDGSVEILGAVSGLVAALSEPKLVAISAVTVSVAGAISMAAGAFLSTHAEQEIEQHQRAKEAFLKEEHVEHPVASPIKASLIVGVCYMIGAAVPVAPFLFGASTAVWSIVLSGSLILLVSAFLAFLSGMGIRKRLFLNGVIITVAVLVSYGIGAWLESVVR